MNSELAIQPNPQSLFTNPQSPNNNLLFILNMPLMNKNISYNKNSYKTIITLKCQEFNHLKEEIKIIPQFICRIKLVEIIQEVKL